MPRTGHPRALTLLTEMLLSLMRQEAERRAVCGVWSFVMAREYNNMEALHVFFKSGLLSAESEMRDAARNLRWGQVDAQESSIAKGWAHGVSGLIDQEVRSKRVCDHMRRVLTVCSVAQTSRTAACVLLYTFAGAPVGQRTI